MWYKIFDILDWFSEFGERIKVIRSFNRSAKSSFIAGEARTLLQAKITRGQGGDYRQNFSKFLAGGFRIKALSGNPMKKSELIEIGRIILDNEQLVRKLISLGWDTLEVHDNKGILGIKWALKKYANIGGYIE